MSFSMSQVLFVIMMRPTPMIVGVAQRSAMNVNVPESTW